jgi:hypothetical protein
MKTFIFIAALFLTLTSAFAQQQGIKGKVFLDNANQLPSPDRKSDPEFGVQRDVLIYNVTTTSQAKQNGTSFTDITTTLVMKLTTRADGSFKVKLEPGTYSVFVQQGDALYANLFDAQNRINPVTVKPRKYAWLPIIIEVQATN